MILAVVVLIIAGVSYFGGNYLNSKSQDAKPTATPFVAKTTAVPATARPSLPFPPNGDLTRYTFTKHEAPFEVVVPSGSDYYYIVLSESTDTKMKVVSLFVHPGETVEIEVPLGNYKMFYATGEKWYGKFDLFGEETMRYQADDILKFYVSGDQIMGHTITLIKQVYGNLETFEVDEQDFPI